jgi:tetratricopeptide (TPR) repeat protein
MLDCQLFGVNAGAMHLVNVLFHTVNSLLLFLLLRRATGQESRSLCAAALFALHPLHVESVAWISERKDVLSTLFWLLATWYYVSYALESRRKGYWLCLLFFALGLMAKPMLVTLPVMFLIIDYWPLQRFSRAMLRPLLMEKLPFLCLSMASSVVTFLVQQKVAVVKLDELPFVSRVVNAIISYLAYLGKTVWPAKLVIFYPHPITYPTYQVILSSVGLVLITITVWRLRYRRPYLIFGWLWYLVTLLPVIGLVQVGSQAMADRYSYVPLIGIFVALTWGVSDCLSYFALNQAYSVTGASLAVAACVIATHHQLYYWKDSVTLFEHTLASTTGNLVAHINVGAALMREGKHSEALEHYLAAVKIKPDNAKAHYNVGIALTSLGRTDEAIKQYRIALLIDPTHTNSLRALADSLLKSGKTSAALAHYQSLLKTNPDNADIHLIVGNTLIHGGDVTGGIKHLREVIRVEPKNFDAQLNLASALASQNKVEEAIASYQKALQLDPNSALAHYEFGAALFDAKRDREAVPQLREALRLSPNATLALDKLAWILSTSTDASLRNGKEAILLAERACQITQNTNAITLATLSAAYAEDGQFEKAIVVAKKGQALTDAVKAPKVFEFLKRQIDSYTAHRPFRSG